MKDYFDFEFEIDGKTIVRQCHFPKRCGFCGEMIANIPNDLVKICQICGHVYMKEKWVAKRYGWKNGQCFCKGLISLGVIESQQEFFHWIEKEYFSTWGKRLPDYR